jgi:beta-phosphoglucomutase-like phosphatase (HAD superfamily)
MPALILAFDGVLADSLPLRRHALREGCDGEGVAVSDHALTELLPGRSLGEAAEYVVQDHADPTVAALIALRAQRTYSALMAHGVPLFPEAVRALRAHAAWGGRVVIRADSERRQVEPLLALAGLEPMISLLRCCDDGPRGAAPSLQRSWEAIDARLTRLGIAASARTAGEATTATAAVARPFVGTVMIGTADSAGA